MSQATLKKLRHLLKRTPLVVLTIATLAGAANADQVATDAQAIIHLRSLQMEYVRDAVLSNDQIRDYGENRSVKAGQNAACDDVSTEELPDLAQEYAVALQEEIGPVVMLLNQFAEVPVSEPTIGSYRNSFLRGFGNGCVNVAGDKNEEIQLSLAAIDAALLLEGEIQRRKSSILQALGSQR